MQYSCVLISTVDLKTKFFLSLHPHPLRLALFVFPHGGSSDRSSTFAPPPTCELCCYVSLAFKFVCEKISLKRKKPISRYSSKFTICENNSKLGDVHKCRHMHFEIFWPTLCSASPFSEIVTSLSDDHLSFTAKRNHGIFWHLMKLIKKCNLFETLSWDFFEKVSFTLQWSYVTERNGIFWSTFSPQYFLRFILKDSLLLERCV